MNEKSNYGTCSYRKLRYDIAFFICLLSKYALKYSGLDSSIYCQKVPKLCTRCHQTIPRFQIFPGGACPRTPPPPPPAGLCTKYALKHSGLDRSICSPKIQRRRTRCHQTISRFRNFPNPPSKALRLPEIKMKRLESPPSGRIRFVASVPVAPPTIHHIVSKSEAML